MVHDHVVVSLNNVVDDGGVVEHLGHLMTRHAVTVVSAAVPVVVGDECERIPCEAK